MSVTKYLLITWFFLFFLFFFFLFSSFFFFFIVKTDQFAEGKSLLFEIIKQLRPGMDLTYLIMPTHILEPISLLEKFTEYFAHVDIISKYRLVLYS